MSTDDRVQQLRCTIALLFVYLICLAAALVSCHYERTADLHLSPPALSPRGGELERGGTGNWRPPCHP